MADERASHTWNQILEVLDKKLQLALLEQAKMVVDVELHGPELILYVCNPEAKDFFNSDVNEQRLILQVRSVITLDSVTAHLVEASPLKS
ncbi:MAG: hypothetical protein KDD66_10685 [Bdellovibrionales bacterium]|nr:hypothetical protein [Bdellovibrionales bacterium]